MKHLRWPLLFQLSIPLGIINFVYFGPAFIDMREFYHLDDMQIFPFMMSFNIGWILATLLYAMIAASFGRRPAVLISCSLTLFGFILGFISLLTRDFQWQLWSRFILGLATSGLSLSLMVIYDIYRGKNVGTHIALAMTSFVLFGTITDILSGWIIQNWGFIYHYLSLFMYNSFVILLLFFYFTETQEKKERIPFHIKTVLREYIRALTNPRLFFYASIVGIMTGFSFLFSTVSPILSLAYLSPIIYAILFAYSQFGSFLGNVLSSILVRQISYHKLIYYFALFGLILTFFYFLFNYFSQLNHPYIYFTIGFLLSICLAFISSNSNALAMAAHTNIAYAAGVTNFISLVWSYFLVDLYPNLFQEINILLVSAFYTFYFFCIVFILSITKILQFRSIKNA